jgi:hypothetical protein
MNDTHPCYPMHPASVVGAVDLYLARTGLYDPAWPLALADLAGEVAAVLMDVYGWPPCVATHNRAWGLASVIARYRGVR